MAFKFVVLCSLLAAANAGVLTPVAYTAAHKVVYTNPAVDSVASTHENVVRSFGGTVSQYAKAIDTPYSSVHKEDTRISNNVYTPAIAKTVTYATPAVAKTVSYAAPPAAVYEHHAAPVVSKTAYAPAATYSHAAPVYSHAAPVYSHAAPVHSQSAPVYSHAAPAVYAHAAPVIAKTVTYAAPAVAKTVSYAAPTIAKTVSYAAPAVTHYNHGPAASTYTHNAPGVAAYGTSQTVQYSPAEMVSHMSFDGFGTHWGW